MEQKAWLPVLGSSTIYAVFSLLLADAALPRLSEAMYAAGHGGLSLALAAARELVRAGLSGGCVLAIIAAASSSITALALSARAGPAGSLLASLALLLSPVFLGLLGSASLPALLSTALLLSSMSLLLSQRASRKSVLLHASLFALSAAESPAITLAASTALAAGLLADNKRGPASAARIAAASTGLGLGLLFAPLGISASLELSPAWQGVLATITLSMFAVSALGGRSRRAVIEAAVLALSSALYPPASALLLGYLVVLVLASDERAGTLLVALLAASSVFYAYSVYRGSQAPWASWSQIEELARSLPSDRKVAAPGYLAGFLDALRGGVSEDECLRAGFPLRVSNGALALADDSVAEASRAPLLMAWNGESYEPLLYVDSSYFRLLLERGGKTWVESVKGPVTSRRLYNASGSLVYETVSRTVWLKTVRRERLAGSELVLEYVVEPLRGSKIRSASLVLWAAFGTGIKWYYASGGKLLADIGNHSLVVEAPGASVKVVKARPRGQDRVVLAYGAGAARLLVNVSISVATATRGGPVELCSLLDDKALAKGSLAVVDRREARPLEELRLVPVPAVIVDDNSLWVVFESRPKNVSGEYRALEVNTAFLEWVFSTSTEHKIPLLRIVDSFVRVKLPHGTAALEGWSSLNGSVAAGQVSAGRRVALSPDGSVLIAYVVESSLPASSIDLDLWIPWPIAKSTKATVEGSLVRVYNPVNRFNVSVSTGSGELKLSFGPHPVYKQPRIHVHIENPGARAVLELRVSGLAVLGARLAKNPPGIEVYSGYAEGPWRESLCCSRRSLAQKDGYYAAEYKTKSLAVEGLYHAGPGVISAAFHARPLLPRSRILGCKAVLWMPYNFKPGSLRVAGSTLRYRAGGYGEVAVAVSPGFSSAALRYDEEFHRYYVELFVPGQRINLTARFSPIRLDSQFRPGDADMLLALGTFRYLESPAGAKRSFSGSGSRQKTVYRSAGLIIVKKAWASGDTLTVDYTISPARRGFEFKVISAQLPVWLDWALPVRSWSYNSTRAEVIAGSSAVRIEAVRGVIKEVGPDPLYGQLRVLVASTSPRITIRVSSEQTAVISLAPTRSLLRVSIGEFKPVYRGRFFVYERIGG